MTTTTRTKPGATGPIYTLTAWSPKDGKEMWIERRMTPWDAVRGAVKARRDGYGARISPAVPKAIRLAAERRA